MQIIKNTKSISLTAAVYGSFALLCHITAILLFFVSHRAIIPQELLVRRCAEMMEYTAMSAVILLIGCFLLYYVTKNEK